MQTKYVKPFSLTWWCGLVLILAGVLVALADVLPVLGQIAHVINALSGGATPAVLFLAGMTTIGLRGAL